MNIQTYTSPTEVLEIVEKCLMKKESENNLPLGLLHRLKKEEDKKFVYEDGREPFFAIGRKEKREPNLVMLQTPPHNLIICGEKEVAGPAVQFLHQLQMKLPGVVGCRPLVDEFAVAWQKETDCKIDVSMRQRIYRLDTLKNVPKAKGKLCYATEDDIALITYWTQEFHEEALQSIDKKQAEEFVRNEIKNNSLFLWRNEKCIPVSMAKRSRKSKSGVVLSLVYTPDEHKRKGYATSCVAALSERLQQEGFQFCSLYTDLDNHTSNSIYMKVGYEPIADSIEYRFHY